MKVKFVIKKSKNANSKSVSNPDSWMFGDPSVSNYFKEILRGQYADTFKSVVEWVSSSSKAFQMDDYQEAEALINHIADIEGEALIYQIKKIYVPDAK